MKKALSILLSLLLVFGTVAFSLTAAAEETTIVAQGYCGAEGNEESLTWTLDGEGTFTVSGTGAMKNYPYYHDSSINQYVPDTPWKMYRESIKTVVLQSGVATITRGAFYGCTSLTSVSIPNSITQIQEAAFYGCTSLSSVEMDEGNDYYYVVDNCVIQRQWNTNALVLGCKTSVIPTDGSVTIIGSRAFASTPEAIVVPLFIESFGDNCFGGCTDLKTVVFEPGFTKTPEYIELPNSVTRIVIPDTVTLIECFLVVGKNDALEIYYTGSEEQWNQIEIKNPPETYPNSNLIAATKHFDYQFQNVPATEATETAHGYTEGVYCDVADLYISGHDVIHNALGEQRVIQEPTGTEEGIVDIQCSVCGEWGRYTVAPTGSQPNDDNPTFFDQIIAFARGIIDWFLRLFKWLG